MKKHSTRTMNYQIRFGTNLNHEHNCEQAKSLLFALFDDVSTDKPQYSRDYNAAPDDETASIYLNFNAKVTSSLGANEIKKLLKDLERQMGRTPERKAAGLIDADFDLISE